MLTCSLCSATVAAEQARGCQHMHKPAWSSVLTPPANREVARTAAAAAWPALDHQALASLGAAVLAGTERHTTTALRGWALVAQKTLDWRISMVAGVGWTASTCHWDRCRICCCFRVCSESFGRMEALTAWRLYKYNITLAYIYKCINGNWSVPRARLP